ncbi:class D sortase [Fictibacillus nanhaiensis]|uniref:class D sortase n=1 Tax=Fictibacillus nanhaiensis TaxID=742169 RepID=UPI001C967F40|nr:class D sortase [Fictibacillus nanhaiensis]MBY6037205.1 class D sortase [Fictibacillus nanhaiensis]
MKWFAYLLLVIGLSTMFYPKAKSMYYSQVERQLLKDWEAAEVNSVIQQSYQQLDDIFLEIQQPQPNTTPKNGILGKLTINQIDLMIPIMEGASQKNLKVAAGHLAGTGSIGEIGNSAIAAHRSYTYGKQFNRLPEVEEGDLIQIETTQKKFTYSVTEKLLVLPTDLSVLQNENNESMITLITCHPMKNPTHRYIVKAVLQKEEVL